MFKTGDRITHNEHGLGLVLKAGTFLSINSYDIGLDTGDVVHGCIDRNLEMATEPVEQFQAGDVVLFKGFPEDYRGSPAVNQNLR